MSASVTHLLYLHGFRSSPQSTKARRMAAWVAEHRPEVTWHCPQLPASPREAVAQQLAHVHDWPVATSAVIAKGDEVLDWREMSERYAGCRIKLLEGGDHALSDFDTHLPEIVSFLGW